MSPPWLVHLLNKAHTKPSFLNVSSLLPSSTSVTFQAGANRRQSPASKAVNPLIIFSTSLNRLQSFPFDLQRPSFVLHNQSFRQVVFFVLHGQIFQKPTWLSSILFFFPFKKTKLMSSPTIVLSLFLFVFFFGRICQDVDTMSSFHQRFCVFFFF